MNQESGIENDEQKKIKSFTDLVAWQQAHKLVISIYQLTKNFPKEEMFGLINQLRRAVVSITSNIAEGFSRQSYAEKIHFYSIAQGSLTEIQNQLLIARDVGYITTEQFKPLANESVNVHKVLGGLIKKSKEIYNN